MKSTFILILFFCFGCYHTFSQTDQIPKHYELKGQAYTQADSLLDVWMKTEYPVIQKKNKLKMSCAKCTNIFMDVVMNIDKDGILRMPEIVQTNCCAKDFSNQLTIEFLSYFYNLIFPSSLRGMKIQFRLGTGLKC